MQYHYRYGSLFKAHNHMLIRPYLSRPRYHGARQLQRVRAPGAPLAGAPRAGPRPRPLREAPGAFALRAPRAVLMTQGRGRGDVTAHAQCTGLSALLKYVNTSIPKDNILLDHTGNV